MTSDASACELLGIESDEAALDLREEVEAGGGIDWETLLTSVTSAPVEGAGALVAISPAGWLMDAVPWIICIFRLLSSRASLATASAVSTNGLGEGGG